MLSQFWNTVQASFPEALGAILAASFLGLVAWLWNLRRKTSSQSKRMYHEEFSSASSFGTMPTVKTHFDGEMRISSEENEETGPKGEKTQVKRRDEFVDGSLNSSASGENVEINMGPFRAYAGSGKSTDGQQSEQNRNF